MLVDSHCHLDRLNLQDHPDGLAGMLSDANAVGVEHFLNVCIHPDTLSTLLNMACNRSDMSVSVGLHPTEIAATHEPTAEELAKLATHPKIVALGETGLDYSHQDYDLHLQQTRFRNHIRAAKKVHKPLIVHTRHAPEDTLTLLAEEKAEQVGGVLHCFTESLEMAEQAIEKHNFYISFSGILTFKNAADIREVAKKLPLERILIETDAPYLTPAPFRGKRPNQPAYVRYVAEILAEIRGISFERVAQQTTENFFRLFQQAAKN